MRHLSCVINTDPYDSKHGGEVIAPYDCHNNIVSYSMDGHFHFRKITAVNLRRVFKVGWVRRWTGGCKAKRQVY